MKKRYYDDNIAQDSIREMMQCFDPKFKAFQSAETILAYSDAAEQVAVLLRGRASLSYINEQGDTSLLEIYGDGDLFGDVFSFPLENYEYIVTAESECEAMFISYSHLISPCEKACPHHSQLISNLFLMTAQKTQELSLHISFLGHQTIRKKLLAYLGYVRATSSAMGSQSFELPMSLAALSQYLCIERTSMMREIRQLKQEGILESSRRTFRLLKEY